MSFSEISQSIIKDSTGSLSDNEILALKRIILNEQVTCAWIGRTLYPNVKRPAQLAGKWLKKKEAEGILKSNVESEVNILITVWRITEKGKKIMNNIYEVKDYE